MAYSGYLIKVGYGTSAYTIPLDFIKAESYKVTRLVQDLDSYRDTDGVLHRNALSKVAIKAEFECVPMLTNTEITAVVNAIRSRFDTAAERKLNVTLYVPETDSYATDIEMYMPDPEYNMYYADSSKIQYNSVRFAFIGYGASGI